MEPERLGPYRVVRLLGQGGMGTVYEGIHEQTGERAAVKVLARSLQTEPGFCQRFAAEIEALRKLRHPNIVQLYGFGEENGMLFYAMELVEGESLEQELRQGRVFGWKEAAVIGMQICSALRHAHDRGVVHRDLKPANLLRTKDGWIKLTDFGIARLFGASCMTVAGRVLGTVEYMAPEQAEGRNIGTAADIYAVGGVLYALLTGRPPFRGNNLMEILDKKRRGKIVPIEQFVADVPSPLARLIYRLLDPVPERRIGTALAVFRRLEEILQDYAQEPPARPSVPSEDEADGFAPTVATALPDPIELPPTQALDTTKEAEGNASEAALDSLASFSVDAIPDTKPTGAFQAFAGEQHQQEQVGTQEDGSAQAVSDQQAESQSTFVRVPADQLGQVPEEAPPDESPLVSLQTWLLIAALIAVTAVVWYALQPPSADTLYERIISKTRAGSVSAYIQAEKEIDQFLLRFPHDPRCEQLREYQREIELYRLERKFELAARGRADLGKLLPAERIYLQAIKLIDYDPELALKKLESLVMLYDRSATSSDPVQQCVELAKRRAATLRRQLIESRESQLAALRERLRYADDIEAKQPERAAAIRKAIIDLYSDTPWAAEYVNMARQALQQQLQPEAKQQ